MARPYRQFPRRRGPVVPLASQAPYLSYWKQPVNQPLRASAKRLARQQPPSAKIVFPPLKSQAPYLSYWVQPTNEPQRANLKRLARQQPPPLQPPPLRFSEAPYLSYWVQPTNRPLKNRVPKRQQPIEVKPPFPPIPSEAPYLSYWKRPVEQFLKSRTPKRQQPKYPPVLFEAQEPSDVGSDWIPPVNQPLRSRVPKRQQPIEVKPPFPAIPSEAPYVSYWKQPVEQPLRKRIRTRQMPSATAIPPIASGVPYISYWFRQFIQPIRRTKRQQPSSSIQNPFYGIPVSVVVPSIASWKQPVSQPRIVKGRARYARTSYPFPTPAVAAATYNNMRMLQGFGL